MPFAFRPWTFARPAFTSATLVAATLALAAPQAAQAQVTQAAQVILTQNAYQNIRDLIAQHRYPQAIAAADGYLAGNARDPQVRFLKGVAQSESGDTQAAILTFTELTQVYPELPEPYNNLAAIHAAQGDYGKARDALLQALQANPSYAVAQENLGDVYIQLALQNYRQAQSLDARNPRIAPKLKLGQELLGVGSPASAGREKTGSSAPAP